MHSPWGCSELNILETERVGRTETERTYHVHCGCGLCTLREGGGATITDRAADPTVLFQKIANAAKSSVKAKKYQAGQNL